MKPSLKNPQKGKKARKDRLNGPKKGRISKKTIKQNGGIKSSKSDRVGSEDDCGSIEIKKKPSKVELKSVIEALKKDSGLVVVRKALKYIPFYLKSEGLTKKLLTEIIRLWAESSEKIRVVCLLCLIRIYTKLNDKEKRQLVIKKLYTTFLEKCRVTKHETMSMIGFMRHSLIELYKLDANVAFKQAQTSCQQLTLTLKNAFTHKNEETYKTVLNWQYANCLILLSSLISSQEEDSPMKSLTHQVIQLNLGAINLLTSPRYYPFYCHLIENLINLSLSRNQFIPILPIMLNILTRIEVPLDNKIKKKGKNAENGKKKSKKTEKDRDEDDSGSSELDDEDDSDDRILDDNSSEDEGEKERKETKTYNMDLLNHVSLDESHSTEYNNAVLDKIHELMVRYMASQCHRIAFPELVFLPRVQMRKWMKKNPGKAAQKFKVLLEKVKTDCTKIEDARKSVDFAFNDYSAIDAWEKRMKDSNKLVLIKMIELLKSE